MCSEVVRFLKASGFSSHETPRLFLLHLGSENSCEVDQNHKLTTSRRTGVLIQNVLLCSCGILDRWILDYPKSFCPQHNGLASWRDSLFPSLNSTGRVLLCQPNQHNFVRRFMNSWFPGASKTEVKVLMSLGIF